MNALTVAAKAVSQYSTTVAGHIELTGDCCIVNPRVVNVGHCPTMSAGGKSRNVRRIVAAYVGIISGLDSTERVVAACGNGRCFNPEHLAKKG